MTVQFVRARTRIRHLRSRRVRRAWYRWAIHVWAPGIVAILNAWGIAVSLGQGGGWWIVNAACAYWLGRLAWRDHRKYRPYRWIEVRVSLHDAMTATLRMVDEARAAHGWEPTSSDLDLPRWAGCAADAQVVTFGGPPLASDGEPLEGCWICEARRQRAHLEGWADLPHVRRATTGIGLCDPCMTDVRSRAKEEANG